MPNIPPVEIARVVPTSSTLVQPASTPQPAPTAPPLYQFYLDKSVITNTRSIHEDTLIAGLGVIVPTEPKSVRP